MHHISIRQIEPQTKKNGGDLPIGGFAGCTVVAHPLILALFRG